MSEYSTISGRIEYPNEEMAESMFNDLYKPDTIEIEENVIRFNRGLYRNLGRLLATSNDTNGVLKRYYKDEMRDIQMVRISTAEWFSERL